MTCPTCHQEIPESPKHHMPLLACPRCAAAKSYEAELAFERQFIRSLRAGEHPVRLVKPRSFWRWHLALAPHYQQAWCGELLSARWARKPLRYPEIDRKLHPLCDRCREVFEQLEERASSEVA